MSMNEAISLSQTVRWLRDFAAQTEAHEARLTELDSAIGDADHGTNMARGMDAVLTLVDADADAIGPMFKQVGMTLVSSVGGASGPLYGTFFMKFGTAAGAADLLDPGQLLQALQAGFDGVVARGKAQVGDKTLVDAMAPALEAMSRSLDEGGSLVQATRAAADAAAEGRDATTPMVARRGRASYLGERSAGHQDPGATSTALLFESLAAAVDQG